MGFRLDLDLPGYEVIVYERRTPGQHDEELADARDHDDQDTLRTYRQATSRYLAQVPDGDFNAGSRFYVGGFDIGPAPREDKDQEAWDLYNAAEKVVMVQAIADVFFELRKYDITVPYDMDGFAASHYAGCLMCKCSTGLVYRAPVTKDGVRNPLNFSIRFK